jgi:dTDP-glucose 4,6-dehydratase
MTWAVIGSNGFTGRAFCDHVKSLGEDLIELSRPAYDLQHARSIAYRIADSGVTHLVNCAALNMVAESWPFAFDYYMTNFVGVADLCDRLRELKWEGRFVQVSTPEVYGNQEGLLYEGTSFNPSTPYAVSRAACDFHLRALNNAFGFNVVFTRSVNVYGPRQPIYRLIPKAVLKILRGEKLKLHGGGVSRRSWLRVEDAVRAIRIVGISGLTGNDYHVSTSSITSIRSLVEIICERLGVEFNEVVEEVEERPGKDMEYMLQDSAIRYLGWSESMSLQEGLRGTVNWFRDHAEHYKGQSLEYTHRT